MVATGADKPVNQHVVVALQGRVKHLIVMIATRRSSLRGS